MPYSFLSHLECSACSTRHDADVVQGLCTCDAPLLARYDLESATSAVSTSKIAERSPDLWRYHELLPVRDPGSVVTFGEGMTPLLPLSRLGGSVGIPRLLMKDEGMLPTGTFKARGAASGISRAKEMGVTAIAMPTNGNAGAAWSAYAARAGMRACIVMPEEAPDITKSECVATGADLYLVKGLINDAGVIVADAVAHEGWFDASTLKEPYRIEGKKTMGFEIVEQLGWRVPDVIVYPTGGGVGLIGIYKALLELQALGWISERLPRLVAVQATGCAPIVRAFELGDRVAEPWQGASTVAFGINVPRALGAPLVLDALYATGGIAVAVDDEELLSDQQLLARLEGCFICPEGAAAVSAIRRLRGAGWLSANDEVVVLNTGAGLKYPDTVTVDVPTLRPGERLPRTQEA